MSAKHSLSLVMQFDFDRDVTPKELEAALVTVLRSKQFPLRARYRISAIMRGPVGPVTLARQPSGDPPPPPAGANLNDRSPEPFE